jgi:hypothetical protein
MASKAKNGIVLRYSSQIPPISVLVALQISKDSVGEAKLAPKNTNDAPEATITQLGYDSYLFYIMKSLV